MAGERDLVDVQSVDLRRVALVRSGYRRGDCTAETVSRTIEAALEAGCTVAHSAGLGLLTEFHRDGQAALSVLEEYTPRVDDESVVAGDWQTEIDRLLELVRGEPASVCPVLGSLPIRTHDGATSVLAAVAGREPAHLKPRTPDLVSASDDSVAMQWVVCRVACVEPALLRRHVANSTWTVDRALESGDTAVTAVRALGVTGAIAAELRPQSIPADRLLTHPNDEMRQAAVEAVGPLISPQRARVPDVIDPDSVCTNLIDRVEEGDLEAGGAAATVLGDLAVVDGSYVGTVLTTLIRQLPGAEDDALPAWLAAIEKIVAAHPSTAGRVILQEAAAFLDPDGSADVVEPALRVLAGYGSVTGETLDIDMVVVMLGHEHSNVRERAVETLQAVGTAAPGWREPAVAALRWSLYDEDPSVRRTAAGALGEAGRLWPTTAATAFEALLEYVAVFPAEATVAGEALTDIVEAFPEAAPTAANWLREQASMGRVDTTAAAACLGALAAQEPARGVGVESLVRWAGRPAVDGGEAAAQSIVAVAEAAPAVVEPYVADLRAALESGGTSPRQWAALATIVALVEHRNDESVPQARWLRERFPEHPLAFGPALARLAQYDPEATLPPLAGLLAVVERRFGSEHLGDTEAVLEEVVAPLIGSHPIAAVPVIRTLRAALDGRACPATAADLLVDALEEWPYLAPLVEETAVARLDDGDVETLAALPAVLDRVGTPVAKDALDQLDRHPESMVRVATRAVREGGGSEGERGDWMAADVDSENAVAETVDAVAGGARGTANRGGSDVVDGLREIGCEQPDLRGRCLIHVLGHVAGARMVDGPGSVETREPVVLEAVAELAPGETEVSVPGPASVDRTRVRLLSRILGCCEAEDPLVRAQAITAVVALLERSPALASATVRQSVRDRLADDSLLVRGRAIRALGQVVPDTGEKASSLLGDLEPMLFNPHSLVPLAAWTVGQVSAKYPDAVMDVAESLTGLLDWGPLDRVHTTATIRMILAAAPSLGSLFAPSLLGQLAEEAGDAPPAVVTAVGVLSGEAIAANEEGPAVLVEYLRATDDDRGHTVVADRMLRVAEAAPDALAAAFEADDAETLPALQPESVLYQLRTYELLVAHWDPAMTGYPFIDMAATVGSGRFGITSEPYDRDPVRIRPDWWRRHEGDHELAVNRIGASILARAGMPQCMEVFATYDTEDPEYLLSPALVARFFRQCQDAEHRLDAAGTITGTTSAAYCSEVVTTLLGQVNDEAVGQRERLLETLPYFVGELQNPGLRAEVVATIGDALTDEWDLRLSAIDALVAVGEQDAVPAMRVVDRLTVALGDADPTVRQRAAEALTEVCLGAVVDIESIIADFDATIGDANEQATARRGRVIALGLIAVDEPGVRDRSVEVLARALSDDDARVRQRALEALATIAGEEPTAISEHLTEIGARIEDQRADVQVTAIDCLQRVVDETGTAALRDRGIHPIVAALDIDDSQVRLHAAKTLADSLGVGQDIRPETLDRLRDSLDDPSPGVRTAAVRCLSYVGSGRDLSLIDTLADDEFEDVRRAATEARERLAKTLSVADTVTSTRTRVPVFRYNAARTGAGPGPGPADPGVDWEFDVGAPVRSSPAIVGGIVYVGADDHHVYAIDVATGEQQWRHKRGDPYASGLGELFGDGGPERNNSSPTVVGPHLYIGHCRSEAAELYALDGPSGDQQWSVEINANVYSSPVSVDGTVYVGSNDGHVYAFEATSGTEQWRVETGDAVTSSPAVVDDTVYIGSQDNQLYALDARDGTERWTSETGGAVTATPAVSGATVYVGSQDDMVYALDAVDGTEKWAARTGDGVVSSPAVVDGAVYVGSNDGHVYAFEATSGTEQWRVETGDAVTSSPAVVDDTVYIGSQDNQLYALDALDGSERWTFETGDEVTSSPAVVDGTVYVGSNDGFVYALADTDE